MICLYSRKDTIEMLKKRANEMLEKNRPRDAISIMEDIIILLQQEGEEEEACKLDLVKNQYILELMEKC